MNDAEPHHVPLSHTPMLGQWDNAETLYPEAGHATGQEAGQ